MQGHTQTEIFVKHIKNIVFFLKFYSFWGAVKMNEI